MSKFAWVILIVVIAGILIATGYLNSTGYFAFDSGVNCKGAIETYTDFEDTQIRECETVKYSEYGCEEIPIDYASNIDDLDCSKICIEEKPACRIHDSDGFCIKQELVCNEYELTCRFGITNLADDKATWKFHWYRQCLDNQPNCKDDPKDLGLYVFPLEPGQIKSSRITRTFQPGAEETVWVEFTSIPTLTFCGDLDKTREECKFVTEQQPVEKTRTVEICD
ncbi:MAG: hypothetical protein KKB03_04710 [Nanoarchaeota archaeon]|nr:hypothetical protein [Nanoarchaeota archaeon]MBU1135367.1 hypothetical protein [Nanoarchaeota archaeon]MBU2520514.1 hypothetical protein [Nanoarchaeota archaeon]